MHALLYITLCELKTADLGPLQSIKPVLLFFASLVCVLKISARSEGRLLPVLSPFQRLLLNPAATAQWMISPFHYTTQCTTAALYSSSNVSDTLETRYLIGNEP